MARIVLKCKTTAPVDTQVHHKKSNTEILIYRVENKSNIFSTSLIPVVVAKFKYLKPPPNSSVFFDVRNKKA